MVKINPPPGLFKIGTYQLGYRRVNLFIDINVGGATFRCLPSDGGHAVITVGLRGSNRARIYGHLFHEVMEFALSDLGCRFNPDAFEQAASDTVMFMYDHQRHTEACARASYFMLECDKDFKKEVFKRVKL